MRTLANIIWHFPFLGFLSALGVFLVGGLFVITILGAPIGLGLIEYSKFLMAPFSNEMVSKSDLNKKQNVLWKSYGFLISILYFPFGLVLTVITIVQIVGMFVSIVGIPGAVILAKSLSTYFNPVNKVCVPGKVAEEIAVRKARSQVN